MKKYKILKKEKIEFYGKTLFRIQAKKNFSNVKKGDKGGWIEKEENLSQEGNCWIYDEGKVFENGIVFGKGKVFDNGRVFGNGKVYNSGKVYGNGKVFEKGEVYGNGIVSGKGKVYGNGKVSGNGRVSGYGRVFENGKVSGNGKVFSNMWVRFGNFSEFSDGKFDPKNENYIFCSVGEKFENEKILLYKRVNKIDGKYFSIRDENFEYKKTGFTICKNVDENIFESCSQGLHFSTKDYWDEGNCLIQCEILKKDIITCLEGKLRVRKCKFVKEV